VKDSYSKRPVLNRIHQQKKWKHEITPTKESSMWEGRKYYDKGEEACRGGKKVKVKLGISHVYVCVHVRVCDCACMCVRNLCDKERERERGRGCE